MSVPICRSIVSRRATNVGYVFSPRSRANRSSTVRQLANGTPVVSGLNLNVSAPADPHAHDEHAAGPRGDLSAVPSWTSKASLRGHSVFSRSAVNSM